MIGEEKNQCDVMMMVNARGIDRYDVIMMVNARVSYVD